MNLSANTVKKVKIVADMVQQHYQPERQDRSLKWCYKNIVNKLYPMGERTFWRYIQYATGNLGYKFTEKDDLYYLDDVFSKMRPETIEKVKDIANEVLKINLKGKSKVAIYKELVEKIDLKLTRSSFIKHLQVAETYLGYQFNFSK